MRKLALLITLMGLLSVNVFANVYASGVEISYTGTFPAFIEYTLNQPATSVSVTVTDQATGTVVATIAGGTAVGVNEVSWDGSGSTTGAIYVINIDAADATGTTAYEVISDGSTDTWYWSPSGVAVNNRQASPYFGTAYIAERTGKVGHANGTKPRGIYMHDAFGSYYGGSQATGFASGNNEAAVWDSLAGDEGAPFGIEVGPDDRTYAFVCSGDHGTAQDKGGVFIGDATFSAGSVEIILPTSGNATSDVLVVGTGADRVMYTVEQTSAATGSDNDELGDGDGFEAAHIMKYALGESTGDASGLGVELIPTSTLSHPFRVEMDAAGFLYVVQTAYDSLALADNIYGLSKWDISGATPSEVWHIGINDAPAHADSAVNAHGAAATHFNGLALDEANGRVWVTRKNNSAEGVLNILAYNMSTGAYETGIESNQWSIRDVNVDAAGNIMIATSSAERLRIFSPEGANSFITTSPVAIEAGTGTVVGIDHVSSMPESYSISQNYPNPFNPSTILEFSISQKEFVTLKVYDITGREVSILVNDNLNAGSYKMTFDGSSLAAGIYVYEMRAGSFTSTKKMMLVK